MQVLQGVHFARETDPLTDDRRCNETRAFKALADGVATQPKSTSIHAIPSIGLQGVVVKSSSRNRKYKDPAGASKGCDLDPVTRPLTTARSD